MCVCVFFFFSLNVKEYIWLWMKICWIELISTQSSSAWLWKFSDSGKIWCYLFSCFYVFQFGGFPVVKNNYCYLKYFGSMLGTAAMLLIMVWKPHISILSISTMLRYTYHLLMSVRIDISFARHIASILKISFLNFECIHEVLDVFWQVPK